jgi:hypothetical protein
MKKVVSEISGAVFSLPWFIAKDHGLFEAEGIDMEFVRTRPNGESRRRESHPRSHRLRGASGLDLSRLRRRSGPSGLGKQTGREDHCPAIGCGKSGRDGSSRFAA